MKNLSYNNTFGRCGSYCICSCQLTRSTSKFVGCRPHFRSPHAAMAILLRHPLARRMALRCGGGNAAVIMGGKVRSVKTPTLECFVSGMPDCRKGSLTSSQAVNKQSIPSTVDLECFQRRSKRLQRPDASRRAPGLSVRPRDRGYASPDLTPLQNTHSRTVGAWDFIDHHCFIYKDRDASLHELHGWSSAVVGQAYSYPRPAKVGACSGRRWSWRLAVLLQLL